jgi:hypothetical protein
LLNCFGSSSSVSCQFLVLESPFIYEKAHQKSLF